MLGLLEGSDVDSGVCIELGFASALGRLCNGLRTDIRQSGEVAALGVNLQVGGAGYESGGRIARSVAELADLPWTVRPGVTTTPTM